MRVGRRHMVAVAAFAGLLGLAGGAGAQAVVDAWDSNTVALAAGDVAEVAVAQINDAALTAQEGQKVELYKQFMELSGMSRNIRQAMQATKASTRLVVIERAGVQNLTPAQEQQYSRIADTVLRETEDTIIHQIATTQAQLFSLEEIQSLITANSSVAAAKYNAAKFSAPEYTTQMVQSYMVDAVVRIVKTFKASMAG